MGSAQTLRTVFMGLGKVDGVARKDPPMHKALLSVVLVMLVFSGRVAYAESEALERTLSPYFMVDGEADGVEPFALESTHVTAHINGVIADVTVEQRYRNGGDVPLH